ncbi:class I SAM-dependent methyltransferase [Sphingomonas sp. HDW15A]|uniref:class I SAM-dependent methyltransferase n=1 Tax=Sphingomonas sp. HDW15A TaxID=2714942 RepID=UPI00140B3110|nr:class I SAM-dependent methyltransferase [Sphingomonas sp. HDW15A]QIK96726.1 class I SAM-dependent methyltransferase [Sphingomonas sp. HDW15A]
MKFLHCLAIASIALAAPVTAKAPSRAVAEAVAAADRPADARDLDSSRKPAEVLDWLGLKPGMKVADLISGTGYWAEIMAHAVGPKGEVTAYEPNQFYNDEKGAALWAGIAARTPRVRLVRYPFEAFAPPASTFDAALINLSYHDLYWESEKYKIPRTDPDAYVRALYAAMKPGGVVGVIDHVGAPGDTRATVKNLHRIDPAVVRADFERAGFRLAGTSKLLANPADDHSKLVFDAAIRGKTDRFMMKFVKPR